MIAHKKENLHRLWMHEQAERAFFRGRISAAEKLMIGKKYPSGFYTPNIFIRIGLFMLATSVIGSGVSLSQLIFSFQENQNSMSILLILWGFICIFFLEYLIQKNAHFRSGVDDALEWYITGCFILGITTLLKLSVSQIAFTAGIISLLVCMRYANSLIAVVSMIAFSITFYIEYTRILPFGKASVSYVFLAIYLAVLFLSDRSRSLYKFRFYGHCLKMVQVAAMIAFYICGNYYIQRMGTTILDEIDTERTPSGLAEGFFWFLTFATPAIYIGKGVLHKEAMYLRTGLFLLIPTYFTYRYYHQKMAIEWQMVVLGSLLIVLAYLLTRYLKQNSKGYSSRAIKESSGLEQAEALIIAGTLSGTGTSSPTPATGGGSSGGGGATGNY